MIDSSLCVLCSQRRSRHRQETWQGFDARNPATQAGEFSETDATFRGVCDIAVTGDVGNRYLGADQEIAAIQMLVKQGQHSLCLTLGQFMVERRLEHRDQARTRWPFENFASGQ